MWTTIQIILGLLALLLAFGGDRLSIPLLSHAAIACFGLTSIAIGCEAIFTQHIVLGRRRHGNRGTYTGIAAVFQGMQFNLLGCFMILIAFMMRFNVNGRGIFLQFVRRPGLPLILFGVLLLMQAVISLSGSHELREGSRWVAILNLWISRLLPGVILVVLGVGAIGLGLFELVAPNTFDEIGGGFLEVIYGLR